MNVGSECVCGVVAAGVAHKPDPAGTSRNGHSQKGQLGASQGRAPPCRPILVGEEIVLADLFPAGCHVSRGTSYKGNGWPSPKLHGGSGEVSVPGERISRQATAGAHTPPAQRPAESVCPQEKPAELLEKIWRAPAWGAQSFEHPTLDFRSGQDRRVMRSNPASGSPLSVACA